MFGVAHSDWPSQLIRKMRRFLAENEHQTEEGELSRLPIALETQHRVMKQASRAEDVGLAQFAQTGRSLAPPSHKVRAVPPALLARDRAGDPAISSLVIIGNGTAGIAAARQARRLHPDCAIHLVSQENHEPQHQTSGAGCSTQPHAWCHGQRITRWTNTFAAEINTDKRRVLLAAGKSLAYDRLIMANVSSVRVPTIDGFGASGTFVLHDSGDTAELHPFIKSQACRKVIVANAGLLGLKAACALQEMGLTVSILLSADDILDRQFDARSRLLLQSYSEHQGIEILTGVNATCLICDDLDRVRAVRLSDGSELETDVFLAGIDVRPDVGLANAAGIAIRHGLLVDDYMQTSHADIYAAGDVAEHDGSTSCDGALALEQGEIAAFNALGGRRRYGGYIHSTRLTGRGIDLLSVGQINADGRGMYAIVSEHAERFKYRKLILASGCLLGAILIGYPDEVALVSDLVERGANLTPHLPALRRGNWDVLAQLKISA